MQMGAKKISYCVVAAAWLAVFCLFGYRATFAVFSGPMAETMHWTGAQVSLGYSLMMTLYATTAFFSGMILDRWGTKPVYTIAAIFCMLGFYLTARVESLTAYYAAYAICAGIGTGMLWVSSTVSVRKWFVGGKYATMWGIAFAGGPMAQVLLSLGVKPMLVENAAQWRIAMTYLSWIFLLLLLLAAFLAKKNPDQYGLQPFGEAKAAPASATSGAPKKEEFIWNIRQAFATYPLWAAIMCFMACVSGEFLIWTQIVRYWTKDLGMALNTATNLYVIIGVAGIFTMPLLGMFADKLVRIFGDEIKARKTMLIVGPATGIAACLMLLSMSGDSYTLGVLCSIVFAIYWAIVPGGVVGYCGSIYGQKSLGKIWGLATWIIMGVGPAVGSFMGGHLADTTGDFVASIYFAMGSFIVALLAAVSMPRSVRLPSEEKATPMVILGQGMETVGGRR